MAASVTFVLAILLTSMQLKHASAQCVSSCGCSVAQDCCLEVRENQNAGTVVGRDDSAALMALINPFSNPTFSFDLDTSPSNISSVFSVNQSTGGISTLRGLDREGETFTTQGMSFINSGYCIQVGISVTERGDPSSQNRYLLNIRVTDINDNPPTFDLPAYTLMVAETTETHPTLVCNQEGLTATDTDDADNAMVRYRVEGSSLFMINDPTTPCVVNAPGIVLDRDEAPTMYSFTLVAFDLADSSLTSQTTVTYVLEDVNDNTPIFENETYNFSILESLQPPEVVSQLIARDIDLGSSGESNLVYSIDENDFFVIDPKSGNLTLNSSVDADVMTPSGEDDVTYTLMVHASDGERIGSAAVIITVLDVNEPAMVIFSSESGTVEITENVAPRLITRITLIDNDKTHEEGNNTIQVIGNNGTFEVQLLFGGRIFLSQTAGVDYEQNTTVQVILETTELGEPVIRQRFTYNLTVLNINDNLPRLNQTQFSFPEETGDETIVDLSQYVFDADIGEDGLIQKYELISVTDDEMTDLPFSTKNLNEITGVLRSGDFEIDRESLEALYFVVNITDMGEPPLSQLLNFMVIITDINDNPPVFVQPSYTFHLMENQPSGTPVGTVAASDPDYLENGTVIYSIELTEPPSQFTIHERTGEIRSRTVFNREIRDSYQISIEARDNNPISPLRAIEKASVTIIIDDVEDSNPYVPG